MSEERPYLSLDERAEYLVDEEYVDPLPLSASAREFLAMTNFHYFLGYARNFRKLRLQGLVEGDTGIDRVVGLVKIDHHVATRLHAALQAVEWRLRASLVEHHCAMYPPRGCFVDPGHFTVMNAEAPLVHEVLRLQIERTREPYVLDRFEAHEVAAGRNWRGSQAKMAPADRLDAMRRLPIWSVVDGWTFGILGRVITDAAPHSSDPDRWMWKDVADSFEVANPIFHTRLSSVIMLRNLVAHHSRLWMRPTTLTPRAPKRYERRARGSEPKSMYVAWLALASFLKAGGGDQDLLRDVDELIGQDPLYEFGAKRPLVSAAQGRGIGVGRRA